MKLRSFGLAVLVAIPSVSSIANAQIPKDRPFSMRSVVLGMPLEEFKKMPVIPAPDYSDERTFCTDEELPASHYLQSADPEDAADGIVTCQWYSRMTDSRLSGLSPHFIELGKGSGPPVFKFINSGGVFKLYQISFRASGEYFQPILAALTANYGPPKTKVKPVQTKVGATFNNVLASWSNPYSVITLDRMCGRTDVYCLDYTHGRLFLERDKLRALRDARAAAKI